MFTLADYLSIYLTFSYAVYYTLHNHGTLIIGFLSVLGGKFWKIFTTQSHELIEDSPNIGSSVIQWPAHELSKIKTGILFLRS